MPLTPVAVESTEDAASGLFSTHTLPVFTKSRAPSRLSTPVTVFSFTKALAMAVAWPLMTELPLAIALAEEKAAEMTLISPLLTTVWLPVPSRTPRSSTLE